MRFPDSHYVKRAITKSMLKPGKIVLLLGGVALIGITEVFALGIAFLGLYTLSVWSDLTDEKFIREVTDEVDKAQLDLPEGLHPDIRPLIFQFARTRQNLLAALKNLDPALAGGLRHLSRQLDESWSDVKKLAADTDEIASYLAEIDLPSLRSRIPALERQASNTSDEEARRDYLQALEARREELANYDALQVWLQRVNAQLEVAVSSADSILSKVMKMRLSGPRESGHTVEEISGRVDQMASEIDAFERSLAAVAGRKVKG